MDFLENRGKVVFPAAPLLHTGFLGGLGEILRLGGKPPKVCVRSPHITGGPEKIKGRRVKPPGFGGLYPRGSKQVVAAFRGGEGRKNGGGPHSKSVLKACGADDNDFFPLFPVPFPVSCFDLPLPSSPRVSRTRHEVSTTVRHERQSASRRTRSIIRSEPGGRNRGQFGPRTLEPEHPMGTQT